MIDLQAVTKTYSIHKKTPVPAVREVSLSVEPGEFVVITGRSGSGKTTLLNLVAGLTRPTSGKVLFDGVEVWKLPDSQQCRLRNQKIGFVFQFPSLLPSLTVLENVLLPTTFIHEDETKKRLPGEIEDLLDQMGLAEKLHAYPRELSAGQQQRVVISRALVSQPDLILADEPTSNLDEQTEGEVMGLFRQIHAQKNITILLVTHAVELAEYGTRSVRMTGGTIAV